MGGGGGGGKCTHMRGDAPPLPPFDGFAAATFAAAKGLRVGCRSGAFAAADVALLLPPVTTACARSAKEREGALLSRRRDGRAAAAAAAAAEAVAASAATAKAERARGRNSSDREENSCVTIACRM